MKKSEFLKIKESSRDSRIGRRSWKEQDTRNDLALVLKKERKREQKWKEKSKSLERKETELRTKKLELEITSISRVMENWYKLTLQDLKFLESLSYSDLSKIGIYNTHWMRWIAHTYSDDCWNTSSKHSYFPKYAFLYEMIEDNSWIDEKTKSELKEKAKDEVWKLVCDEIEEDTFLYNWGSRILAHIFKYIPQKTVANKLRWTWNRWTNTNVDVLWRHIDLFTELDEDYKKEIKREYNKEHGIIDPEDVEEEKEEKPEEVIEEDCWYEKTWDEALDAYMESGRKDAEAFIKFMGKKEKEKRRFDDWLEKEWWL